jgi:Putative porin
MPLRVLRPVPLVAALRYCCGSRLLSGLFLGASFTGTAFAASEPLATELREQIMQLRAEQARIADVQRDLDAKLRILERQLARQGAPPGAEQVPTRAASIAAERPRLNVSGDLRLRGQSDRSDEDARSRTSSQARGRVGATYEASDQLTLGARLVTGDADGPNSTDVQLSSFADDLDVSLDLAYMQWKLGHWNLFGGKIPQPFVRTDLVWDSDVNPQGVSALYKRPLADGSALRLHSLFFVVDENAVAVDSTMVGAQLGYDTAQLGDWKLDLSASYYDYRLGSTAGADAGDFRSNLRRADGNYLSDFDLGNLVVGASWTGAGARWPVRMTGDYVHNFGARTDADTGYSIDIAVGRASQQSDWRLTYGYSLAQTDAVLAAFSHDNIGIATNYRLHALTLDYVPVPRTIVSTIWYRYRPHGALHAGSNAVEDWLDRVRIAFLVSF